MQDEQNIYEVAGFAYQQFERATRHEGEPGRDVEDFTRLKNDAPEWLRELVIAAHGDFLPDDWRYDCIRAAIGFIHDNEPEDVEEAAGEFADGYVDVYNASRTAWLASNLNRAFYCDDAAQEFGFTIDQTHGVFDLIALGQYAEAEEVYFAVARALSEHMEDSAVA